MSVAFRKGEQLFCKLDDHILFGEALGERGHFLFERGDRRVLFGAVAGLDGLGAAGV